MSKSIQVRIRHEDAVRSVPVMGWDAADLHGVIPALAQWGVYSDMAGEVVTDRSRFSAQIMIDDEAAYFEVILHDED